MIDLIKRKEKTKLLSEKFPEDTKFKFSRHDFASLGYDSVYALDVYHKGVHVTLGAISVKELEAKPIWLDIREAVTEMLKSKKFCYKGLKIVRGE